MKEEARKVIQQAIQVARSIENVWLRSEALKDIAEAMARAGMKEKRG